MTCECGCVYCCQPEPVVVDRERLARLARIAQWRLSLPEEIRGFSIPPVEVVEGK